MKKVLIITVGGSKVPLMKSLESFLPNYLFLICSQQTNKLAVELEEKAKTLVADCEVKFIIIDNPESIQECFEKARRAALQAAEIPQAQVRVDYTGGTKSMSAAAVLATADFRFEYAYTGGEKRDQDNLGRVIDGYEKLYEMPVPLAYLQSSELEHIRQLYSGWNLEAARRYCAHLNLLLGRNLAGEFYKGLEMIMEGFYWWDNFRHETAGRSFSKVDIEVLQSHELSRQDKRLYRFLEGVKKAKTRLEKLNRLCSERENKPSIELSRDLLANADRRAEEGRFDDAILRLYRTIEMTVQATLLEDYGLDTANVPVNQLSKEELQALTSGEAGPQPALKLAMENAVRLLEIRAHRLWKRMEPREAERKKIQQVRNHCYLAHQLAKAADSHKYERFRNYIVEVLFDGVEVENFPIWEPAVKS